MTPISIKTFLSEFGPARSSLIVKALRGRGLSAEAARQRLSRATEPVRYFPVPLLPKREAFFYLQQDRGSERFWDAFKRDLRESGSVFGAAIDGMSARGGVVTLDEFAVISGAPVVPQKGQLSVDTVAKRLLAANFIEPRNDNRLGPCYSLTPRLGVGSLASMRPRQAAESVLLDGLREWARRMGLASYNSIAIRGDRALRPVGPFSFDLAGPSYLLPLQRSAGKPGFLVADVFADGILDVHHIQFFVRKARMLKAILLSAGVLPILVGTGFTGPALTAGHAAGVILTTPRDLFGSRVAATLASLVETLKTAASYASSSPDRLIDLMNGLQDIEGRAGNLRGVMFELMAGYLARRGAVSIDMGVTARDPETGTTVDIDVQKITAQAAEVIAIECKGKGVGGVLDVEEVQAWLKKLPTIQAHYRGHYSLREAKITCELWTSGEFHPDALTLLREEQRKRTKMPIAWRDGRAVLEIAKSGKEKAMTDALYQHFLRHPLNTNGDEIAKPGRRQDGIASPSLPNASSGGAVVTPAAPPQLKGPKAKSALA
jgi:hypothetical protein